MLQIYIPSRYLLVQSPKLEQWRRYGVFIVTFEHLSQIVLLVFPLLTLNM